jgi:hypothetical protein
MSYSAVDISIVGNIPIISEQVVASLFESFKQDSEFQPEIDLTEQIEFLRSIFQDIHFKNLKLQLSDNISAIVVTLKQKGREICLAFLYSPTSYNYVGSFFLETGVLNKGCDVGFATLFLKDGYSVNIEITPCSIDNLGNPTYPDTPQNFSWNTSCPWRVDKSNGLVFMAAKLSFSQILN